MGSIQYRTYPECSDENMLQADVRKHAREIAQRAYHCLILAGSKTSQLEEALTAIEAGPSDAGVARRAKFWRRSRMIPREIIGPIS